MISNLLAGPSMSQPINRWKEDCPRCGLFYCDNDGRDRHCPNCLFYEAIPRNEFSCVSTSNDDSLGEDDETQTLGELVDQVADDPEKSEPNFENERYLET